MIGAKGVCPVVRIASACLHSRTLISFGVTVGGARAPAISPLRYVGEALTSSAGGVIEIDALRTSQLSLHSRDIARRRSTQMQRVHGGSTDVRDGHEATLEGEQADMEDDIDNGGAAKNAKRPWRDEPFPAVPKAFPASSPVCQGRGQ